MRACLSHALHPPFLVTVELLEGLQEAAHGRSLLEWVEALAACRQGHEERVAVGRVVVHPHERDSVLRARQGEKEAEEDGDGKEWLTKVPVISLLPCSAVPQLQRAH